MHPLRQVLCRHIWKHTLEMLKKMQPVWLCFLWAEIGGHIFYYTVEKRQTNATNVITHCPGQAIWGQISKFTVENKTNKWTQCKYVSSREEYMRTHLKTHSYSQLVGLCMFWSKCFEDTFESTQWRKVKQMQPMWLCILLGRPFEETFENTQRRKVKQMQPMWLCILS